MELGMVLQALADQSVDDQLWTCAGLVLAGERAAAGMDELATGKYSAEIVTMLLCLERIAGAPLPLPIAARGEA